ncbi:MAG TPA: peptidoglycan DD-metalloendopeptidase family protein [Coleofasciculaceae cyanobacterium]|jgi:murein DD-endopeptidase MepM/ murein hydrolase activator NlpD
MSIFPGTRALKSFLCLLLAVGLMCGAVPGGFADNRSRLQELQGKTRSVKAQAAEMRRKKYEKMRAAQRVSMNIAANQQRLEREKRSLKFHEQRLGQTKDRLVYLDDRLDRTMGDAMRLGQDAGQRLRSLYMGERLSMLQMILEANDLSTLLDRIYYKKQIMAQDKRVLDNLRSKIQELNGLKTELARQKTLIGQTIATIRVKNVEIQRSISIDRVLRDKYKNDAAFYDRAESELLAESANITSQIRALTSRRSFRQVRGSTGSFIWPISGSISSGFGSRFHPIHRRTKMHTGLDIAGPNRGAVRAADGGQVIWAGWKGGYGKAIMINHGTRNGRNLVTLYGHLSSISVSSGENVSKGQVIGAEGSTGYSTGPHLHFEVRVDGAPVNPMGYL